MACNTKYSQKRLTRPPMIAGIISVWSVTISSFVAFLVLVVVEDQKLQLIYAAIICLPLLFFLNVAETTLGKRFLWGLTRKIFKLRLKEIKYDDVYRFNEKEKF
jgi:type IV secretory pathway VirB3-like protein